MTTPMKGNRGKMQFQNLTCSMQLCHRLSVKNKTQFNFSPMSIRLRSSNQQYGNKLGRDVLPCGDVSFHDVSDPCVDYVPVHCNRHAPIT